MHISTYNRIKVFFRSATARLSGTYLAIIMLMSIGFSIVLYHISSQQLGRQLPPNSLITSSQQTNQPAPQPTDPGASGQSNPPPLSQFLQDRISEGRSALLTRLLYLNIGSLCVGAAVSYGLARRSLRPLERAMEAQVQFVSDASHELRTPLTAIQTSNEVFLRRKQPLLADALGLIEQNTDDVVRLKELSDALLSLAVHEQAKAPEQVVETQDIISDALTKVAPQAIDKRLSVHDNGSNLAVKGSHAALVQVLIIVLDNAVKYSDKGSAIYVTTHKQGRYASIAVRDEGIGIQPKDIPKLFSRFYRADNARTSGERSGYGLGLAIAKQIIETHHGSIKVTSRPGAGSTFTIKLVLA